MPRLLAMITLACLMPLQLLAFETRARAAYVYDMTTDVVLMDKNGDLPLPPASMSKLMTINMLFEALRDGRVTLETRFGVSQRAQDMGGSTMFLNTKDRPTVEELIQGIVVLSGNDACVVVAEGLAGTEEAFATKMNERARALGLSGSNFVNSSGWPAPEQRMSMRDLVLVATRLISEFPEYYGYFSETEFPWDNRAPDNRFNRNPLLKLGIGADGLKTGHTEEAGFGIVGSAVQGDRRIVFAITGLDSDKARAEEAEAIVNWAFRQFIEKTVSRKGAEVARAAVFLGAAADVGLTTTTDLKVLIPATQRDGIKAVAYFNEPLAAPVAAGQEVGRLEIQLEGLPNRTVPLITTAAIEKAGFMPRVTEAANVLLSRYLGGDTAAQ